MIEIRVLDSELPLEENFYEHGENICKAKELTADAKQELEYRYKHLLHVTGVNDYVNVDVSVKELEDWLKANQHKKLLLKKVK